MSIQAVTGRITQILTMQQELLNPQLVKSAASATGTAATAPATGTTGTTPGLGSTSTTFSAALANAQAASAGGTVAATSTGGVSGNAPAQAQVQAMVSTANSLLGKPYVMGGGHAGWAPSSGYDCSGFVSAVLHAGGYLSQPADTTALPNQPGILSGPGQHVTIYDRALPGGSGHVIIEIDGQFYESGGSAGPWGGGGGVAKIGRPSDAYLANFPTVLHPSGL
jgi:cell wall-associated NlpC family hydrolase